MTGLTRRTFLAAGAATAATALGVPRIARAESATPPVCLFSKHLGHVEDYDDLARTYHDLGLDGCDLTVRRGGHVLPERVAEDLPRVVEAFDKVGLSVPMITTGLQRGDEPDTRPILEAASKLGIRYFRCGGQRYADDAAIPDEIDRITAELQSLADVAAEYDMIGGFHNHSGFRYFGAPLWDLYEAYERIGSENFGANLDLGHTMAEGSYGAWEITTRLLAPHVKMMAVKDFVWGDGPGPQWVPLGEGRVRLADSLRIVRAAGFAGPISIHIEYRVPRGERLEEEIRQSAAVLREALKEAGYA